MASRLTERYPLRVTIVVVLLTLVAAALVGSGVVATTIMRGYLTDRVDSQLGEAAQRLASSPPPPGNSPPGRVGGPAFRALPSPFFVQAFAADGTPADGGPSRQPLRDGEPTPDLPTRTLAEVTASNGRPFDAAATSGSETWRVVAVPLRGRDGYLMVAQSLGDMNRTIQQLVGVQAAAGVILLVLLAGIGTYVVRRSLRGLEDVEHTAVAIAAGDLGRRVPQRDPRTEVGRLSVALNQMLGQIETAFAQRTASEDAARRSEDRMRRFVADASHELRTPLTSIRGFAELTRQRGGSADPATMRRIEDEAKRMGLLVDDLLLLARLDQQRPLRFQPVDLLTLAGDAVRDAEAVQPARPIRLQILPGSVAPVVDGDEDRLRQVFANLVGNALHHTPADALVVVSVGTRGGRAVLEVADHGPGLTGEQKVRVFERFYRADTARARDTGGSGLGLSIVAALVAAHDGDVTTTDTPGGGTTFTVTLPLAG